MKDFYGKLIIMDFWFSGCPSCISLEIEMKQIRKMFQSDSNVVFISINADNNRKKWKENLHNELYSGHDEVNLFTNGLGIEDPLIRYYGFIGFPQMVIINQKQRIVTTQPPFPVDDTSRKMFIRLIQQELNANY
jgi:thiol-disulfide isomerase/thioredoxin